MAWTETKRRAGGPVKPRSLIRIRVAPRAAERARGKLSVGPLVIACALGPAGMRHMKREGDGSTPVGRFRLRAAWRRSGRMPAQGNLLLPWRLTRPWDGWCDASGDARYNRPVRLPFRSSAETMWRADGLYDLVFVLDYNLDHPRRGRGSAIFLHVARDDLAPTAGCIALRRADLLRLAPRLSRRTQFVIG